MITISYKDIKDVLSILQVELEDIINSTRIISDTLK